MANIQSRLYGGTGGNPFDDAPYSSGTITGFSVWYGQYLNGLTISFSSGKGVSNGQTQGTMEYISFASGERLIAVFGSSGDYVDQIGFVTLTADNQAKTYGPFGGPGGAPFLIAGEIATFFGRSGQWIDAIGAWVTSPAD